MTTTTTTDPGGASPPPPWFQESTNAYGTRVWGKWDPRPHPKASVQPQDGLTGAPVPGRLTPGSTTAPDADATGGTP